MATETSVPQDPQDGVEVEWQLDALDLRPVERWLATLPGRYMATGATLPLTAVAKSPRRLIDRYLDTDDWRVARAGFVLRSRRRGRGEEATLKDTRPATPDGLRRRLEVTEALGAGGIGALGSGGPVGRRVAAVAGRRPLRQVLEIRTRRRPFALRVAGQDVAELALDETTITGEPGQRPVTLRRVELEVVPAWVEPMGPVVHDLQRACGLRPATLSKFEAGLLSLGMEIPGPPDLGSTQVTPESTFGHLAYAVLRRQLGVMLAREPGTRLGEDIEELHDMRVATRRLRAAFDFFADALPLRARSLHDELTWVAAVLGEVRDLDVQIEHTAAMEEWAAAWSGGDAGGDAGSEPPLDTLRRVLEEHRTVARRHLLDALDSPRWERLVDGLTQLVTHPPARRSQQARLPASVVLPDLVMARHRTARRAARRADRTGLAADYHRLRIRCKRLRYSLEFTSGIYGSRTTRVARQLATLQDALGLMQDAEVATGRLRDMATGGGDVLPASTVFVMGAVAEHYRIERGRRLAKLPKRLGALKGRAWKDLSALMDSRRLEALALQPAPRPLRRPPAPPVPEPTAGSPAAAVDTGRVPGSAIPDSAPAELPPPVPGPPMVAAGVPEPAVQPAGVPEPGPPPADPRRTAALAVARAAWPDPVWGTVGPAEDGTTDA